MSTYILNTPDSSSRDSSIVSTPALSTTNNGNNSAVGKNNGSPNSKNNSSLVVAGTPPSPRASNTPIVVPRRIFVGGFPPTTTESELRGYFETFGCVRDVKIIRDHGANAKGKYSYGFVTFDSDEEAKKLIALGKVDGTRAFEFRGRYLNVNEAVKKPPVNKLMQLDTIPPSGVVLRDVTGQLFTIQNGYAIIANPDAYAIAQPQPMTPSFPFVVHNPIYMAATAPAAPFKYTTQHQASSSFGQTQTSPASAPVLHQPQNSAAQQVPTARFIFPPHPSVPMPPFNSSQLAHLPPTPVASPVNPDSPSKTMLGSFNGNNPAIANLTTPFPSVLGSSTQQMPPSPYRWTTSTIAGPVTQLVYPGGYPTFVHDVNHPYSQMQLQQQPPQQQHHQTVQQPIGSGQFTGYYASDQDYNSFSALDSFHELQIGPPDRRQSRNAYRLDGSGSMKE